MTHSRHRFLPIITALLALVVAACGGAPAAPGDAVPAAQQGEIPTAVAIEATAPAPATAVAAPTPTPQPAREPAPTATPVPATETAQPEAAPATEEPQAEPSPTPAAAEDDQPPAEQSLAEAMAAFPGTPTAQGEVILVTGKVVNANGEPLPGAAVEFWQTDANGVYDHPGDRGTSQRDRGFQFYGTSIAGDTGTYVFRTVKPGEYEPRPRHIHVKVKIDGQEVLTTQFYFQEDQAALPGEGVFQQAGSQGELLLLAPVGSVDVQGTAIPVLGNDLVIDTGAGTLTPTPSQSEGPYYPVVVVADYDNDLAAVP